MVVTRPISAVLIAPSSPGSHTRFVWRIFMETKTCAACGQTFQPHHKVPTQTYCSSSVCQKVRRQNWQRDKQQSDPDYRDNQRRVQQAWIERNPDYWREYRKSNVASTSGTKNGRASSNDSDQIKPSLVKMDELTRLDGIPAGVYRIRPVAGSGTTTNGTWVIEITPVCDSCTCKVDDCKDRTCWKFSDTGVNVQPK